ncbi:MAG: hypothetical protein PHT41_03465 [Candidatus Omnitrophica bacterium]|nr:hypothetical protein [Candidatus Omnitrophota bacterium]
MQKARKEILKEKKRNGMKAFVEPKLMKRGSLKEITFSSDMAEP